MSRSPLFIVLPLLLVGLVRLFGQDYTEPVTLPDHYAEATLQVEGMI